jgi:hypothetical protein
MRRYLEDRLAGKKPKRPTARKLAKVTASSLRTMAATTSRLIMARARSASC